MKKFEEIPYQPMNANEYFLHACMIRLDALCHMVDSLVEYIAKRDGVAVESVQVETKHVEIQETPMEVQEVPVEKKTAPKRKKP